MAAQATNTVTVGCKLPHGLHLQIYDMDTSTEHVMGGGSREIKIAKPVGDRVTLKGYAHAVDKAPTAEIVGGFALTHGVSAEFMDRWMKDNAQSPLVKNGFVFVGSKPDSVTGQATERKDLINKMEPLNPNRMPKGLEKAKA